MRRALLACAAVLACAPAAGAQPTPAPAPEPPAQGQPGGALPAPAPRGPADIIGGAGRARAARELEQAGQRGGAPPAAAPGASDPHAAAVPHGGAARAAGKDARPLASERPDASLPDGTIRVTVFDQDGVPARAAEVVLGVMNADSTRTSQTARSGADGVALFSGLATGEKQAYRVNVPYQGAKYSSNPFRLSPNSGGYQVEIQRMPVTRDPRMLVLYVGATSIELKDERIHIVQQSRLWNVGSQTYVFPEQGALVKLPAGFLAVQVQDSMADQHVKESAEGVRITGSIPPGEATMLWGFDIPLHGSQMDFALDIPWPTFAYRVISDAPAGFTLAVKDMPAPLERGDAGRKLLVTEIQRKIGDEPFRRLEIALRGIPGPGPGRWIAGLLALFAVGVGVALSRRAPAAAPPSPVDLAARRAELFDRARALDAQREAGEIGPEYHAEQLHGLGDELAAMLYEEDAQARAR